MSLKKYIPYTIKYDIIYRKQKSAEFLIKYPTSIPIII